MLLQMRPRGTQQSQTLPWGSWNLISRSPDERGWRVSHAAPGQTKPAWKTHYQLVSL